MFPLPIPLAALYRRARRPRAATLLSLWLCGVLLLVACSGPEDEQPSDTNAAPPAIQLSTATSVVGQTRVGATATAGAPDETIEESPEESGDSAEITGIEPTLDADGLVSEVATIVEGSAGFVEVVLATPEGGTLFAVNEFEPLEAASLYKLGVMVEVFRQIDAGALSMDELVVIDEGFLTEGEDAIGVADIGAAYSVDTLLFNMIDLSSNVAATALLWKVGTDNVNATLDSLGLASTEIRWYPLAYNAEWETPGTADEGDGAPATEDAGDSSDAGTDGSEGEGDGEGESVETPTEVPAGEEPTSERTALPGDGSDVLIRADPDASHAAQLLSVGPTSAPVVDRMQLRVLPDLRADASMNVTSAADVAALLGMLQRGEVVSPEGSAAMLELLSAQEVNDRLPAWLPADALVAHKTGNLDALSHDAGIIYTPAGPVIVVVLTEDLDDETANALMAQIGLSVWTHGGGS